MTSENTAQKKNLLALSASHVTLNWEDLVVIEDASLTLVQGSIACILGKSGSGKTTLFHALAGLSKPLSGSIQAAGDVGYMLQDDLLLPTKTIEDNASLALQLAHMPKAEARACARKALSEFGLAGTEKLYPHELSGGMRQRVALVRTYLAKAQILLADEPFSALDAITRTSMQEWFLEVVQTHGLSALVITHDIDEALLLANDIYILQGDPMQGEPSHLLAPFTINRHGQSRASFSMSEEAFLIKKEIRAILTR